MVRDKIEVFLDFAAKERLAAYAVVGLGLCRGCLGWILALTRDDLVVGGGLSSSYFVGIGEMLGFFVVAWLARRALLLKDSDRILFLPVVFISAGACCAVVPFIVGVSSQAAFVVLFNGGCVLVGFGYAVLFVLWLELLGLLTPRKMPCAFALAYFVNLIFWLACRGMSSSLLLAACLTAVAASTVLLLMAYRAAPTSTVVRRSLPRQAVSGQIVALVVVFAGAYGIGDSITGMGYSTFASKFGMAIPELVVLLCFILVPQKFEIGVFYRMTFVLMFAGLLGAFLSEDFALVAQLMMSASNECFQLFALTIACLVAYQNKASAAMYCGILEGAQTLFVRVGAACGGILPETIEYFYVIALAVIVVMGFFLLPENKLSEQIYPSIHAEPREDFLARLASEKGLSKREETVFMALAEGKTYSEISEELFIAPSTTRAHASRIYEKFGVHTRQEFDAYLQQAEQSPLKG